VYSNLLTIIDSEVIMTLEDSTLLTPPIRPIPNSESLSSRWVVLTTGQQPEPEFMRTSNQSGSNATYVVSLSSGTPGIQTPEQLADIAASSMRFSDFAAWMAFRAMDAEEDM
jgi:hypothetical protein